MDPSDPRPTPEAQPPQHEPWKELEAQLETGWRCRHCEKSEPRSPGREALDRLEGALFRGPDAPRR